MDGTTTHIFGLSPLPVAVIGIVLATAMLVVYHCIVAHWCSPTENNNTTTTTTTSQRWMLSLENVNISLIPSIYYHAKETETGLGDDATCVVCLCEFTDGEAIRILPKCLHSFHAPCIDMWLGSHSSCPLCRTTVMSARHVLDRRQEYHAVRLPDSGQT